MPVSTSEWMPSEIIAELPVIAAAMNLMVAIARFPTIAAMIAFLDSAAMAASLHGALAARKAAPCTGAPGRRRRDGGA